MNIVNQIFYWTGAAAWAIAVLLGLIYSAGVLWQHWQKNKFRYWIYQPFEYLYLKRLFARFKKAGWKNKKGQELNWQTVKLHYSMFQGKVKEFEYLHRHLFKKQILKIYEELMSTEGYRRWYNRNYNEED